MFKCPKCGYRLPACWKAHKHFLYAYYCRLDEFASFYSEEVVQLLKEELDIQNRNLVNPLREGEYTFHLTNPRKHKTPRYILLILTEFEQFIYRRDLIEKHVAANQKGQTKLEIQI